MTKLSGLLLACGLCLTAASAPALAQQTQQIQAAPAAKPVTEERATAAPVRPAPPPTVATPVARDRLTTAPLRAATPPAAVPGTIAVAANAGWVATGVRLQKGGQAQILARDGRWSTVGKAATTAVVRDTLTGADGYPNSAAPGTVLPSANRGALIGRIGTGAPFLIGSRYAAPVGADGELYVSINDAPNELRDNQGGLYIAVRATPPPTREPTPVTPPARDPVPGATKPPITPPAREPTPGAKPPTVEPPPQAIPEPPTQTPPPAPKPTDDALAQDGAAPIAPPDDAPPPEEQFGPTPAPEVAPTPEPLPVTPAIPVVPIAIGAAVLAGLLLLGSLFRPRRKPSSDDARNTGAAPQVSTRIVSDGVAGQSLTVTRKQERRS